MKKMLLLTIALVLVASVASAASIVGSAHDMRTYFTNGTTQVCVYCHTPHQAAGRTTDPLWNHTLSTNTGYGVYASSTLNASVTQLAGNDGSVGSLCMSCHDGSVSVTVLWKAPADGLGVGSTLKGGVNVINAAGFIQSTAGGFIGTDLSNDHPVNFNYTSTLATQDGDLVSPSSTSQVVAGIPLYGGTGSMQCPTCHNVHDNQYGAFLRLSNVNSALCTTCHSK